MGVPRPANDAPGDEPTGDGPPRDEPLGDKPPGDGPLGDERPGHESEGDDPAGDGPLGDEPPGGYSPGLLSRSPVGKDAARASERSAVRFHARADKKSQLLMRISKVDNQCEIIFQRSVWPEEP